MATDYNEIGQNPRINYRNIFTPYSDKTHFIYELVQNADDNKSQSIELQLYKNELLVWNDGCQFREEDVRSICSIGFSNKDLTQIGTFGMGFKAVYTYTDNPEVYSGDERFRISINNPTKPEGIDKMTPEIAKLVDDDKTVFRLPFMENLRQEEEIALLKDRLCTLEKRSLLFLRNLKMVHWCDESSGQMGSYSCHRRSHNKIQGVSEVELKASLNGDDQSSETFLIFRKEIQPPQMVIDELLRQSADDDERQRIQRSASKLQPIEVAFKTQDGKITAMNKCVLFSYFPTEKETHLRFFIQASYKTTLARDNIKKDNQWNDWLIQETAKFLPDILEELKEAGLLEPAFFNILPVKGEVGNEFKPIAEALLKAMREGEFVPTQDGYAKSENVFYPHRDSLRTLIESSWLYPNSNWLHSDIGDTEEFRRCFKLMREAGVKEIDVSQVLDWLEKQDNNWFESRCEEWLRSLYIYLNSQGSELGRIKRLPLVRLENGRHVSTNYELVFFPPDTDEGREELRPFLRDLPILQSVLLDGEEGDDIKSFLDKLGVKSLYPEDMIGKWIIPQYSRPNKPSKEQNLLHVRYIFKVWNKLNKYEHRQLKEELSKVPILLVYNSGQPETYDFVKPCGAYLPKAYTGDTHLETYFSVYNGDIWFVDSGYLDGSSNSKEWFKFLKAIGAIDTPRVAEKKIPRNEENYQEFGKKLEERGVNRRRCTKEYIKDFYFYGLQKILPQISHYSEVHLSRGLWYLLIKAAEPLSPEKPRQSSKSARDAFFQGSYHYRYYNWKEPDYFDATFYSQLKETTWLPDEQGKLRRPSKLFAPTDENRKVLADSVAYLHPDFDISQDNETARWLAEKLGIHLNANTDSVINYLQTLSGTEISVEKVEPLYRFLARQDARRSEEFKQKLLIFTSNSEPSWWKADEVFWEDESPVFGNRRGYLKENYADYEGTLKPFFRTLDVSERAAPSDYVEVIQEVTSLERAGNAEVRDRVETLYRRIMPYLQEDGGSPEDEEWQKAWKRTRKGRCWLGKKRDEWGFFYGHELVWNDHPYIAGIFEGKVPFWEFDDLLEFAKNQGVKGCSEADVTFHPSGDQEEDEVWSAKVRNLRPYIHAFLNSQRLCEVHEESKSAHVLDRLSVRLVEGLETTYTLKGISVTSQNPRPSFLDLTDQEATLWLALEAKEDEYAELIGDASQDYFGVKELRGFVEDLLTKDRSRVLTRWKRDGLRVDLCESTPEMDYKESEEIPSEFIDEEVLDETGNGDDSRTNDSENKTLAGNEDSETGNEDNGSTGGESDTPPRRPRPGRDGARWRGGSGGGKPNRSGGTGYGGGGGEGEDHKNLKDYLADNPSELGDGLKLVEKEHSFNLGGRVDILLEDGSGNPVTVEVKPYNIPPGSNDEIWQAVRYKHVAAAEYDLQCDQVRSILAAPEIPDDVKAKCKQLGIEVFEKTQR